MSYVFIVGTCVGCGKMFSFHPNKVPSISITGVKEPICEDCVKRVNPIREAKGLSLITYSKDAYEVTDEQDIDWTL